MLYCCSSSRGIVLVQCSYFWTRRQLLSKPQIFTIYTSVFYMQLPFFWETGSMIWICIFVKGNIFPWNWNGCISWCQGKPQMDTLGSSLCRLKERRGANWAFKAAEQLYKPSSFQAGGETKWPNCLKLNSQLKEVCWCSSSTKFCWW